MEKAPQPTIDFQKLYKEEKMRSLEKLTLKPSTITNAYNMLQDLRYIIILDFRDHTEFLESRIRKSIEANLDNYVQLIQGIIATKDKNHKSHYEGDDMKRVLMVFPKTGWKELEKSINGEIEAIGESLLKTYQERLSKVYYLKDFAEFKQKYPFLCVNDNSSERELIKSICRYPSEIKEKILYLGNMTNIMDKNNLQLECLGIKSIVYFTPEKFEHLEQLPNITATHYQIKEPEKPDIDFDIIVEQILADLKAPEKRPIFLFDVSGIISAAICVKVMLETNKAWSKEIAMAYIINKRYEAKDMPSWLYSQIFLPGKKKVKSVPLDMP